MHRLQVFDSLLNPVAVCSLEGEIVFVNEAWENYGSRRGGMNCVGKNYLDFCVGTDTSDLMREELERLMADEIESFVLEYPCHGPLEDDWFEAYCSTFEMEDEEFIVIEHVNISERRILANEVKRLQSFLTSHTEYMNHEIRNKISIISGHTELIRDKISPKFPQVVDDHIRPVMNAVDEISFLMETNKSDSPLFESVNVREINFRHAISKVVSQIASEDAEFNVRVSGDYLADEAQLRHLIENLILNSIEHSGEDTVEIFIDNVESDSVNGFYIEDSGRGFSSESNSKFSEDDFDTGLEIVETIAENHEWSIEFENTDRGGRVIVTGLTSLSNS